MGGYNIASLVNEYLAKKETWLVLSIISGIVFLIIALIVIFLRKRIVIAIALVKEGSKYVKYRHCIFVALIQRITFPEP